jgi:hypothetical protein
VLIDYNYTPLLRILLQMNQSSSFEEIYGSPVILTFQKIYGSPLTLTFPQQLIELFKPELAQTCKTLYECYEQFYKEKTAVVLYDPKSKYINYAKSIESLRLRHRCLHLKFVSISDSASSNCPVKIVCLNQDFDVSKEVDCLCANALIAHSSMPRHGELNASFDMFTNLSSLSLCHVIFGNNAFSIICSLSSIKFIQLKLCKIHSHLVEKCTIPQIQLEFCEFLDPASMKLPSSLEIFKIASLDSYKVNASDCTQLKSL